MFFKQICIIFLSVILLDNAQAASSKSAPDISKPDPSKLGSGSGSGPVQDSGSNITDEEESKNSLDSKTQEKSKSTEESLEDSEDESMEKSKENDKKGNEDNRGNGANGGTGLICTDKLHPVTGVSDCPKFPERCNPIYMRGIWLSVMRQECRKTCKICT
uniref:ShKT domain-containing protein n=1 Tax=Ditylenchus dipsaci TaxID=166011 RepID=A0A915D1M3_9BILA